VPPCWETARRWSACRHGRASRSRPDWRGRGPRTLIVAGAADIARHVGGSIGVSLVSNVLANRGQFHQTRLVELIIPSSTAYQNALQQITDYFVMQGNSLGKANLQAIAWIGQQFQTQVAMLASMDVFWVLMLVARAAIPLALSLRKVTLGGPAPAGH
jgi:MFS transporter, DHA2 family, multidrug resistance protein